MGISVGLVGLGSFGSAFVELFAAHPLVGRVALCDREPERVERFASSGSLQGKFRESDAYCSLDGICESDLDALVVMTQPWLHAPQAVRAMEWGKHVYSAVPVVMLPDGDEILGWCDRLVETCRRTGMRYMLGETSYYRPAGMYCRRRAAQGAFGRFVYAEGEYFHDYDLPTSNLIEVRRRRESGASGREWAERKRQYFARGCVGGPMHYPTHSTCGAIFTMRAHMTRVCAWATRSATGHDYFANSLSNEVALFEMSNGATVRIGEFREVGHPHRVTFQVYGTDGCFKDGCWVDKTSRTPLTVEEMRDPLPPEVLAAFQEAKGEGVYGGHGGSHAYLVHEFVEAIASGRQPAVNAWEAVRYMAPGVMAHKSALRDGELLDVPDWGDAPE